jgi:hypothetical protein
VSEYHLAVRRLVLSIFVVLIAGGCLRSGSPEATEPEATPAEKPAQPEDEMEVLGLQLLREVVDIMLANQEDCDQMAAELDRFSAARQAQLQRFKDWSEQQTPEEREARQQRRQQDIDALRQEAAEPLVRCGANPSVQQAVERMK